MIKIEAAPYSLHVTGHAGSMPRGANIVCAAASILMYTLATGAAELEERGLAQSVQCELNPGDSRVYVRPYWCGRREARLLFENALRGFRLLQQEYPQDVYFTAEKTVVK